MRYALIGFCVGLMAHYAGYTVHTWQYWAVCGSSAVLAPIVLGKWLGR